MIDMKKWMTKVMDRLSIVGGFEAQDIEYTPTYVSNSYYTSTAVARCRLYRTGARTGILRINLVNDSGQIPASQTAITTIGTFNISATRDTYAVLAPQRGTGGTMYVQLSGNTLSIANYSSSAITQSTFFRIALPIELPFYSQGG